MYFLIYYGMVALCDTRERCSHLTVNHVTVNVNHRHLITWTVNYVTYNHSTVNTNHASNHHGNSDVNKDLGLKAKAKDSRYQGQIFHRSSPYFIFFIVNVV